MHDLDLTADTFNHFGHKSVRMLILLPRRGRRELGSVLESRRGHPAACSVRHRLQCIADPTNESFEPKQGLLRGGIPRQQPEYGNRAGEPPEARHDRHRGFEDGGVILRLG
jgi:hypothetical protein